MVIDAKKTGTRGMKSEDCIFYQLAKTNQAAARFWSKRLSEHKVTAVQGMVLNFLLDRDNVTAKNLGERTLLDSATLTGVIDRLEALSLIRRGPHPDDRRSILLTFTDKGRALARDIRKAAVKANKDFLKGLGSDDESALRNLLLQVRER